jgi:HK97 gp10 family phage protein
LSIKIKLEGFDEMLKRIEEAGGTADRAANSALSAAAKIMDDELRAQLNAATESDLAQRMPHFKINKEGGNYRAEVGFQSTPYSPRNPSDYHKAVFLNYGTPDRKKHGKEAARGFITRAKRRARPKIKRAQKEALEKIIQRLQK